MDTPMGLEDDTPIPSDLEEEAMDEITKAEDREDSGDEKDPFEEEEEDEEFDPEEEDE